MTHHELRCCTDFTLAYSAIGKRYKGSFLHSSLTFSLSKLLLPTGKSMVKRSLLQAWTGPEGSRRRRLPYFMTIGTRRFTPPEIFLVLISGRGCVFPRARSIMSMKVPVTPSGIKTPDLAACSAVPQPNEPPRPLMP